ncbi:RNA-binding protein [Mucilaginibacter sp. CSA2-8R]|uniref:RNA recognition motif domain-containing protein n=1 Tax=Mucilaginibacter sp. CSA2-8R TaxID=3141542 RepID=UPI00315D779A
MVKLFVSGFPLEITEMELAQLIAPHGDIATIKIVRDRQTKKCKGYAFVEMATLSDAENAVIALDGAQLQDRELTLKISEDKPVAPKPSFKRPSARPTERFTRNPNFNNNNSDTNNQRPRRPRLK